MNPKNLAKELKSLNPSELFETMCKLYGDLRFIEYNEPETDMLLYQFGVFDWGQGEYFELDLTRQFIDTNDEVSQLHATLYFEPNIELRKLEEGSVWCESPSGLDIFEREIQNSEAYRLCRALTPLKMKVTYENV